MFPSMGLAKVSIQPVAAKHLAAVEQLFYKYPFKDFQLYQLGISKDIMASILKDTLKDDKTYNCAFWEDDRIAGLLSARPQPWISGQFNANMYSLKHMLTDNMDSEFYHTMLSYITGQIENMDFLDCRVANGDISAIQALESYGFRFTGNEVYMARSLVKDPPGADYEVEGVEPCPQELRDEVISLAQRTHVHNRYMYDPHIDRNDAIAIYSKYMAGFAFGPDYRSVVKIKNGRVLGFLFYKFNRTLSDRVGQKYASLDFIGVDTEVQNHGIGEQLNRAALLDLAKSGTTHVVVRTFGNNYPAIRILQKVGFQITASDLQFHLWLRPKAKLETESAASPLNTISLLG